MARRFVAAFALLFAFAFLVSGTAYAGPGDTGTSLAVPKAPDVEPTFGFTGTKPRTTATTSGIARPTPAPRVTASGFGAARPRVRSQVRCKIVVPSLAPAVDVASSCENGRCSTGSCVTCPEVCTETYVSPSRTIDGRCTTGTFGVYRAPVRPATRRVATDPLDVPATFWSSGYHDGRSWEAAAFGSCDPCNTCEPCDPCRPCPTVTRCDPCEPREPCAPRRVVRVRRRAAPCDPCEPCAPRRVVRRYFVPCASPCDDPCGPSPVYRSPCAPSGCGPCAPRMRCAPRWGGCGPRWGGCGPGFPRLGIGLGWGGWGIGFGGCW